jgi:hypothetical protein
MLQVVQQKIKDNKIAFAEADITKPWTFDKVNLITCSLDQQHQTEGIVS